MPTQVQFGKVSKITNKRNVENSRLQWYADVYIYMKQVTNGKRNSTSTKLIELNIMNS